MKRRNFIHSIGASLVASSLPLAEVQAAKRKRPAIRFAHLTDIHVKPGRIPEAGMAEALHHVQSLKDKPAFIINGGDGIMDALEADKQKTQQQFDLFRKILNDENSLPVYHTIGNHDIWGWFTSAEENKQDNLYGKKWVQDEWQLPKRYYHFLEKRWHFFVLDSTQLNPAGGYIGKLDEEQYEWLEQELKLVPADNHICIVSHIPILSICAGLFFNRNEANGDFRIPRNLMHSDFLKIKKLFLQYPQIKVCISGHIHLQDEVEYLGIKYYCNGAVSGNWWNGYFQEFGPAYSIMELYEDGSSKRIRLNYSITN